MQMLVISSNTCILYTLKYIFFFSNWMHHVAPLFSHSYLRLLEHVLGYICS